MSASESGKGVFHVCSRNSSVIKGIACLPEEENVVNKISIYTYCVGHNVT